MEVRSEAQPNALAGLDQEHDLHLALADWASWASVTELLQGAGADVQSLQLARSGATFSVRCRLRQLTAERARELTDTLLDTGLAQRASVEHLVMAKRAAGAGR